MLTNRPDRKRLRDDTDGAILVVGIAMGLLLVGALWHIVSVGDAILWRERLQDGADSAAFENAVWNARGMNIIVFLNIVMAAVMAILVVLNGLYIFFSAALAALHAAKLACLFAWFPSGITQALCAASIIGPSIITPAQQAVGRARDAASRSVPRFITGIQTAQQIVASVTPLVGVKEATLKTHAAYEMLATGLSPSLVPSVSRLKRLGTGVSLPVQEGDESRLCEKAGEFVPNEILALLEESGFDGGLPTQALEFFRGLAGDIAGNLSSVFCGNRSPGDIAALHETFMDVADSECSTAERFGRMQDGEFTEEQQQLLDEQSQDAQGGDPAQRAAERERREQQLRDLQSHWSTRNGTDQFDHSRCKQEQFDAQNAAAASETTQGSKPAEVWDDTANGDFFMQSWGFSYHPPPHVERDDRGLTFVEQGSTAHLRDANVETLGTAQAEMYWDPVDCDGSWDGCKAEAMWKMRWKARLRRLHNPVEMAGRAAVNIAVSDVVSAASDAIGMLTGAIEDAALDGLGSASQGGGFWSRIELVLRGTLWDAVYSRLPVDPIGWATGELEGTVREALEQDPPAPNELVIH
jgi:hypothetical protein